AFGWVLGELPRGLVGYDRIARVLDAEGSLRSGDRRLEPRTTGAHVAMRDVSVSVTGPFGEQSLLQGVDLELTPGRTVALVGVTGAGKTTLVSLLSRLQDPTTGTVLIDGTDLREVHLGDLTSQVALVA